MDTGIGAMHELLDEVAQHMRSARKSDKTAAVAKLNRIAALATTLAFTIQAGR
jgi:hypothetical protein